MARVIASAASGTLRDEHYILNAVSGLYERSTLLEIASGNVCLQSENFGTTWAAIGSPTRVAAAHTASGITLDLIGDDSGAAAEGYSQTITFTGNAVKAISVFVKQGSSTSTFLQLLDTTAVADRLSATIGWSSGLPSVNAGVGTFHGYDVLHGGVFRLFFTTTAVTAANTNSLRVYPSADASVSTADTGTIYAGGVQAENNLYPTSYRATTTVAVTRNADVLTLPFTPVPQTMSAYVKFRERGTTLGAAGAVVMQVGAAADTAPQFKLYMTGGVFVAYHHNGSAAVSSSLGVAPTWGQTVELLATLSDTGAVTITQSINGAASTSGSTSAANAFASAWSDDILWLNSINGTMMGVLPVLAVKIAKGVKTLAEMRLLADAAQAALILNAGDADAIFVPCASADRSESEDIGGTTRAYAGNLRVSTRDQKRVWNATTSWIEPSDSSAILTLTADNQIIPCSGLLFGNETVSCSVKCKSIATHPGGRLQALTLQVTEV